MLSKLRKTLRAEPLKEKDQIPANNLASLVHRCSPSPLQVGSIYRAGFQRVNQKRHSFSTSALNSVNFFP